LISNQGRYFARGFDPATWPGSVWLLCRGDPSLFNQLVEDPGPIDGNDPGDGSSVIGDRNLSATANFAEIAAELISKLSDSHFWHSPLLVAIYV